MRRFPSCSTQQTRKYNLCQEGIAIAGLWTPSLKSFGLQWKPEINLGQATQHLDTFHENKANQGKRNNREGCLGLLWKECIVLIKKHAVGTCTVQCDFLFASSNAFPHLTCSSCPHLPKMLTLLVLSMHVCMVPDHQHDTSHRRTKQS